jgi:hypothetical protein
MVFLVGFSLILFVFYPCVSLTLVVQLFYVALVPSAYLGGLISAAWAAFAKVGMAGVIVLVSTVCATRTRD